VKLGSPEADEIATGEWRKLLDSYADPGIPDDVDAALRDYIDRRTADIDRTGAP
jgi:trimethylamine:corrinoid methyltransferase-like protein